MNWISKFQLFLFDLDGLLVNTEELHYRAYAKMCKDRGFVLPWDFSTYFKIAQQDAEAPKRNIYKTLPELYEQEPDWSKLYLEKKKAYLELISTEEAPLMPGAERILLELQKLGINRCVVTHSAKELVDTLRRKNPVLNTIQHWLTREDYSNPKPSPDGYVKAIELFSKPGDHIIGFEDSSRGMRALMQTRAVPIFVSALDPDTKNTFAAMGVQTFSTLDEAYNGIQFKN